MVAFAPTRRGPCVVITQGVALGWLLIALSGQWAARCYYPTAHRPFRPFCVAPFGIKCGIKFGKNDKQLLLLIDGNPAITASDAALRMEISLRGAEKIFKKLRDAGVVSRQGSKKNGSWVINK